MKPTVFIHTNDRQIVGALVAEYSMKRNSPHADRFDVRIIRREEQPVFAAHEGRRYLRDGAWREWKNDDLQSFTPLRFLPPVAVHGLHREPVVAALVQRHLERLLHGVETFRPDDRDHELHAMDPPRVTGGSRARRAR